MSKLLCVSCDADAWYVYLGKSLCVKHFKEWSEHATKLPESQEANL